MQVEIKFYNRETKETKYEIFTGGNASEIMNKFIAFYPHCTLQCFTPIEEGKKPFSEVRRFENLTDEEVRKEHRWWKGRYSRAKFNEDVGVYLWSKMSEHNAEMHYLKTSYYEAKEEMNIRGLKPIIKEVK